MPISKTTQDISRKSSRALLLALVFAVSSLTGCLSSDDDEGPDFSLTPEGEVGGVRLSVYNPTSLQYDEYNDQILVGAVGNYFDDEPAGGVQAISWEADSGSFSTEVLFKDDEGLGYGKTSEIQVVAEDRAYLVGYQGWGDNALYAFDPGDGEFERNDADELKEIADLSGLNLADLALGPNGNLWVAVADTGNPRIVVIDANDDSEIANIDGFDLNPGNITFTADKAVISTASADSTSSVGSHALVDVDTYSIISQDRDADGSDLVMRASGEGDKFFRLARSNMEYVARYVESSPDTPEWTKNLGDDTQNPDPNPHDLVFVDDANKAYLLMMNEHEQWLVRPDAPSASNFRDVGSLDLSAYAMGESGDKPAKAHTGVIVDNLLFVAMQRWYRDGQVTNYAPAYVAVFDTSEWGAEEEIETGLSAGTGNGN